MPANQIKSVEKDILNLLGEEAAAEFYTTQNTDINRQNLHRIIIDETGKFILIEGDIQLFNDVLTAENMQRIFEQNIGFIRSDEGLIVCRAQPAMDDVELSELIYINQYIILESINRLRPLGLITSAEYSLLLDLLTGLSTKQSAAEGDVSYHTRRNQVKSLIEKLSVNGQTELIRNVVASIFSVAFNAKNTDDAQVKDVTTAYLDTMFSGPYRFHKIQLSDNVTLRAIDFGPITGDPVIVCHGSFLTFYPNYSFDWLYENNMRILMPLRPGCSETLDHVYDGDEYLAKSIVAIDRLIDIFSLQKPTILSMVSGAIVGLEYARLHGDKIKKLVMTSSSYIGVIKNSKLRKMVKGMAVLGRLNQVILKKIVDFYLYKLRSPETTLRLLTTSHEGCEFDQYVYKEAFSKHNAHPILLSCIKNGWQSFYMSCLIDDNRIWNDIEHIQCPVLLVHGQENPFDRIEDIRLFHQKLGNSRLIEVEGKGQNLIFKEIGDFFKYALDDFELENSE